MTVAELTQRLSNAEYHQWRAFHAYRQAMLEKEAKKEKAARRGR